MTDKRGTYRGVIGNVFRNLLPVFRMKGAHPEYEDGLG